MTCPRIPSWVETEAQASNSELRVSSTTLDCLPKEENIKERQENYLQTVEGLVCGNKNGVI